MLLLIHIVFALASIPLMAGAVANEYLLLLSSQKILPRLSFIAFAGMLSTGTALVIRDHLPILSACLSGLFYLSVLSVFYLAYRKAAGRSRG